MCHRQFHGGSENVKDQARRTIAELGSGLAPVIGGYLANAYNPGVPFLVYAPLLLFSAALLGLVGKETLDR